MPITNELERNQPVSDDEFYARWNRFVYTTAYRFLFKFSRPMHELDNLISEGMYALVRIPRENRWSSNYVRTAIVNKIQSAISYHDKAKRRGETVSIVPDASVFANHSREIAHAEARMELERVLSVATDDERQLFDLILRGLTLTEAGDELGIGFKTFSWRYTRALKRVRLRFRKKVANAKLEQSAFESAARG